MTIDDGLHVSGFALPDLAPDNTLNRVLASALGGQGHSSSSDAAVIYWDATYFDLDRVAIFQGARASEQQQILQQLNQDLWQESLSIEQAGIGYMAKMVLMAESNQERMLYGLFAADETHHLAQLQAWVPSAMGNQISADPFLRLLSEIVGSTDKAVLLFVLQVVLEGWGLTHYRRLARGCRHRALRDLFQGFLQAESRHHGAGVTLFRQTRVSSGSQGAIVACLATFLQMVRVGPQRVVSAIATTKGHLSRSQRIHILQQLDTVAHSHQRLQLLKSLMGHTGGPIINELERQGLFDPLSPEEAANYG